MRVIMRLDGGLVGFSFGQLGHFVFVSSLAQNLGGNEFVWPALAAILCVFIIGVDMRKVADHVHALDDAPERDILAVQSRTRQVTDEKLRTARVRQVRHGHAKRAAEEVAIGLALSSVGIA